MPGVFSSGGGRTAFPSENNLVDLRYPAAMGLEDELRDYFRGLLQSPDMGYTPRPVYDPMETYLQSMRAQSPTGGPIGRSGFGPLPTLGPISKIEGPSDVIPRSIPPGGVTPPTRQIEPASGRWGGAMPGPSDRGFAQLLPRFSPLQRPMLPAWAPTVARSVASRPAIPNTVAGFQGLLGPEIPGNTARNLWRRIAPMMILSGQMPVPPPSLNTGE